MAPNNIQKFKGYTDVELKAAQNSEIKYLIVLREQIELPLSKADIREFKVRARQAARDLRAINKELIKRAKKNSDYQRPF